MSHGSRKPVRKCHACLLNQGESCWIYQYPRGQWRGERHCPGLENEELYEQFRDWLREPTVKSRSELRREFFRTARKAALWKRRRRRKRYR